MTYIHNDSPALQKLIFEKDGTLNKIFIKIYEKNCYINEICGRGGGRGNVFSTFYRNNILPKENIYMSCT